MPFFAEQTFKVKTNPVCTISNTVEDFLSLSSSFNADKNKVMDGHKRQDYEGICVDLLLNFFCAKETLRTHTYVSRTKNTQTQINKNMGKKPFSK